MRVSGYFWRMSTLFRGSDPNPGHAAPTPHDSAQVEALARRHSPRMAGRVELDAGGKRKMRHAVEIRNASFVTPDFVALLRKYKVAMVVADTAGKWPDYEDVCADFMYLRLHGDEKLYASGYSEAALQRRAARIRAWAGGQPDDAETMSGVAPPRRKGRDVFCYFDNDVKPRAPFDARRPVAILELDAGLGPLAQPNNKPILSCAPRSAGGR
jgi:uncharacterized protein YecE (DUF72 family)